MSKELNRAQKLRARTGLSQRKFAERFGMSVKTIQAWEVERTAPPKYVLDLIEKVMNYEDTSIGGVGYEKE